MVSFRKTQIATFVSLSLWGSLWAGREPEHQPNVILIVADDLGYADLNVMGNKNIKTPNIDAIVSGGASFTNGYVTAPICGPSRVGILTGRYQDRIGFSTNHGPKIPENYGLPKDNVLLPSVLRQNGYKTGMVGKWHLGFKDFQIPTALGFDYFYGFLHGYHSYKPGSIEPGPLYENDKETSSDLHLTEKFTDKSIEFIKSNQENPFFLYLPYNAVHGPYEPKAESVKQFQHIKNPQRRKVLALISELDAGVGKITKTVESLGLSKNTVIIFLSDNGGVAGSNSPGNGNLRSGKGTLFEGGIRVPFFVKWTGKIPAGKVVNAPVISLDIFPTILKLADTKTSISLEGKDFTNEVLGASSKSDETTRTFFWKYIANFDQKAVRKGSWKLIQNSPDKPAELYNLSEDIGEHTNVADKNPAVVKDLLGDWEYWNSRNKNPLWLDPRIKRKNSDSID